MTPYELRVGDRGPVQHSPTTCGSASLTVARMLADPGFAEWVRTGDTTGRGFLPELRGTDERVAAAEQLVLRRTNRLLGPGRVPQPPWPRGLGTPPWGARHELEHGAALPGTPYDVRWCRLGDRASRARHVDELTERVTRGRPAALYIGSTTLPRHVTLVLADPSAPHGLALYDPSDGRVRPLDAAAFAARRLGVAGWDVPWCSVRPRPRRS